MDGFGALNWRCTGGILEVDLTSCRKTKTLDRDTSETQKKTANSSVSVWVQGAQMGEGRQGEIKKCIFLKKKKNVHHESSSWSKGWKDRTRWNPGAPDKMTSGDSQSSQAHWTEEIKKGASVEGQDKGLSMKQDHTSEKEKLRGHRVTKKAQTERSTC